VVDPVAPPAPVAVEVDVVELVLVVVVVPPPAPLSQMSTFGSHLAAPGFALQPAAQEPSQVIAPRLEIKRSENRLFGMPYSCRQPCAFATYRTHNFFFFQS
jgi:hypothetical protein